ncbi:MAG: rod shape-determining protein MreC [Bacteroidota bacterium]
MRKLIDFLYSRRVVTLFIGLQLVNVWLIVKYNQRHNANFLNSSNTLAAKVSSSSQDVSDYFSLSQINEQLILENERLQSELNSIYFRNYSVDTIDRYTVIGARVVNNSFRRAKNFLTIDVGKRDSIFPGMGVISPSGVVGQVKSVSNNYSTVYSVLHPNVMVSSIIKRTSTICTVQWDQRTYNKATLRYVPRHIPLEIGDTVLTSGYNSVFPQGVSVGIVDELNLEDHMTFYEAKVKLSTDFTSLPNVFVIVNELQPEIDSLEFYE